MSKTSVITRTCGRFEFMCKAKPSLEKAIEATELAIDSREVVVADDGSSPCKRAWENCAGGLSTIAPTLSSDFSISLTGLKKAWLSGPAIQLMSESRWGGESWLLTPPRIRQVPDAQKKAGSSSQGHDS